MSSIPEQDVSPDPMADVTRPDQPADLGADRPHHVGSAVDLTEAVRQLELAAHDIAVAAACLGLGDLNEAHINAITARAAADAAEEILRIAASSAAPGGQPR